MDKQLLDRIKSNIILIGIIVLSIFLNFYNLGERAFQQDEAIYSAQSAMAAGHSEYRENFIPYSRSATNFQMQQIITSISFRLFGINEFSARLPIAIMGILSVIIVYLIADMMFNRRTAIFSAFIMGVNGYVLHFSRQFQLDTGLTFFTILAILFLIKWSKTKKDWQFYLFLISTILAIMVKVAAIFILLPLILFYLIIEVDNLKNLIKMVFRPISILIIIVTLLYVIYFINSIGFEEFIKTFIYAKDRESIYSPIYYIEIMRDYLGYIIPIIAVIGLVYILRSIIIKKYRDENKEKTRAYIFISFWFLFGVIFFSFYPLKAYSYILPILPAISILNGIVLDNIIQKFEKFNVGNPQIVEIDKRFRKGIVTIFLLLIIIIISIYPTLNISYAKTEDINEIGENVINRFDPIKDYILKDTGLWLKENVDPNSKVVVNAFTSHHDIAFYSGLETYTLKFVPGYYTPINKTATIVWGDYDVEELIKNGEIDYVVNLGESNIRKTINKLKKNENVNFIPYYNKSYNTPKWFSNGSYNVTIYQVEFNELRFITVGDPHTKIPTDPDYENRGNERLEQIINFINNRSDKIGGVDFVVFTGDMTEYGTNESNELVKKMLTNLKKPYYIVVGNHDILVSQDIFRSFYGPARHVEKVNGYQVLFIGMHDFKDDTGKQTKLEWSFNFSDANKNMPTLVFMHGPALGPPPECDLCKWQKDFFGYGYDIRDELDNFSNLIGVYSGHVHFDSEQEFKGAKYITINGLVNKDINGMNATPSNKIGYTIIKRNEINYTLIPYR